MDDQKVKITGLDIPFMDLVMLMIKLAFASIPAMFVVYFVLLLFGLFFDGFFGLALFQSHIP